MTTSKIEDCLIRLEKKIDQTHPSRFLNIREVSTFTSLSDSTIRRAVKKGELKCCKKIGKLLFLESDVRSWLNG
ncbi:MAG: helix-turn-helix domain-containing protein [Candidatus Scalindua sp.]|jgi:predicted DNA-binding transcriptional regulator AlpA|nr:helix-turn-helix domain-containing protein [Candidatus Neomarinimicrobiota bacterium]MBT6229895.1 helix-turn-helix domain-containing protein [Candidatus Scalindua sp.]